MNSIVLIGRLTKDAEVTYTPSTQMAVATFTLAVNREIKNKDGKTEADFPRMKDRIAYHADEKKHRYEIGKGVMDYLARDIRIGDL